MMHYGDVKQLQTSRLVVNIYKHSIFGTLDSDYQISSISHCSYISIELLKDLLGNPNKYFQEALLHLLADHWYSVTITTPDDDFQAVIDRVVDVSESEDEMLRVH